MNHRLGHPLKDMITIILNFKKFSQGVQLLTQHMINRGQWVPGIEPVIWLVKEGQVGYLPENINTPLELVPGIQIYGEA